MGNRELRVVMLVNTPVHGDARVVKTARTVQDMGYDVHVVGRDAGAWVEASDDELDVTLVKLRRGRGSSGFLPSPPGTFAYRSERAKDNAARRLSERTIEARSRSALAQGLGGRAATRIKGAGVGAGWALYRLRSASRKAAIESTLERTRQWLVDAPDRDPRDLAADDKYWRVLQPQLSNFEVATAPVIEALEPDIIHAHDYHALGVAVRMAARARLSNRSIAVIYDAHEFVAGLAGPESAALGRSAYEAGHIRLVDRVVTVSDPLAHLIAETHGLEDVPQVTLNAPDSVALAGDPDYRADVRSDCGLAADVPLLVYSGGIAERRGLDTAVAGLAGLPGVHLAIIGSEDPAARARLRNTAERHGVADRLHILDFVPQNVIIQHLRTADAAIHPLVHLANHEIAMPNKFFDYMHAGLPMVVSDVKLLSSVVLDQKLGTVFLAEDPASFTQAAAELLASLPEYRSNVAGSSGVPEWTWEGQRASLEAVYRDLV